MMRDWEIQENRKIHKEAGFDSVMVCLFECLPVGPDEIWGFETALKSES